MALYARARPAGHWADYPDITYGTVGTAEFEKWDAALYTLKRQSVDPTDTTYGAVGDFVADDTAALAAAITDAGTYGSIYLPFGKTFAVSSALNLLTGQRIWGPGILKRTAASTSSVLVCDNVTDVNVDVVIDGNRANNANTSALVNCTGGSLRIRVCGLLSNNSGPAVRFFDSSRCLSKANVYNCQYGVVIGSQTGHSTPCNHNSVADCVIDTVDKNGVFVTGDTASASSPATIRGHRVDGVTIYQPGDTGIELGQGSRGCVVTNVYIDGNNVGNNGILIRDSGGHSVTNFYITNFAMFANGSNTYYTLGNGVFFWPQYTGTITDCAVADGVIENCSRGVFAQGNNTTFLSSAADTGGAGTGGQVQGGNSLTNIVVDGTQLGNVTGANQNTLNCHGFYIQSVSAFDLSRCTAKNCKNDGFRLGDNNTGSSYITDVGVSNCRAFNNGQQAVGGQTYYGFNLNGATSQSNVKLNGCRANDTRASGSKTQSYGFGWNGNGAGSGQMSANAGLVDCTGSGNAVGLFNSVGSDMKTLGGTVAASAGSLTITIDTSVAVYTGTGGHTFTLQSAVTMGAGHKVLIRNLGTAALTIARTGSATLSTTSLAAGAERVFVSDGSSNWY